jgi:exonuclease SbcD
MRLLHTSDWHLGQSLHNFERGYEHQCFLDWLLDTIVAEQADALLIAGDVFDNANPSSAAQRQLYRFLQQARARAPQLDLIVIAGNHDSPGRLEAPGPLLEAHGTQVIGNVPRGADGQIDVERLVLPLTGKSGAVEAWCLAVPFLRPGDVPRQPDAGQDGQPPADPYLAGIALLYQQACEVAQSRLQPGQSIIAMGHCHMVDGQMSNDSERRIVIGGTEMLPTGIFGPSIAYAALGHLHLAQAVGKQEGIRYCGSPIPLSFAETGYRHQILRVDLGAGGAPCEVSAIPVPRAVELMRVPAKPAPLEQVLEALAALPGETALPPEAWPFLEVRVLLDAPQPGMRSRVEAALEGKPFRLAKIETSTPSRAPSLDDAALTLDQLDKLQPDDIFKRLYLQRFGNEAPADQLSAFAELMLPGA